MVKKRFSAADAPNAFVTGLLVVVETRLDDELTWYYTRIKRSKNIVQKRFLSLLRAQSVVRFRRRERDNNNCCYDGVLSPYDNTPTTNWWTKMFDVYKVVSKTSWEIADAWVRDFVAFKNIFTNHCCWHCPWTSVSDNALWFSLFLIHCVATKESKTVHFIGP